MNQQENSYYRRLWQQFVADFKQQYWAGVLAVIGAVCGVVVRYKAGNIAKGQEWTTVLINLTPPALPLIAYAAYYLIRTPKKLDDLQIEAYNTQRKEIESERVKAIELMEARKEDARSILFEQDQKATSRQVVATLREELLPYQLLANNDVRQIERMILTWKPHFISTLDSPTPFIEFECFAFNGSLFSVSISEEISGFVSYGNRRLNGSLTRKHNWKIDNLRRGETAKIKFQLWLESAEADYLKTELAKRDLSPAASFRFQDVRLTITGNGIEPRPLQFNFGGVDKNQVGR